ncbi:MAG: hypothetical protein ACREYC_24065 [Gammaproteobacteria bacterium]
MSPSDRRSYAGRLTSQAVQYFDTSSMIKRYVHEPQAEDLQARAAHVITHAETLAGLT